jgi:Holliday junction resolvasome RuvABC endonuclease subunit
MRNLPSYEDFLNEEEKKPLVGHTVKRKKYKSDPPDIGLYSKGGKDAIKGTGYANKEKAEFTVKKLDYLMDKGERVWAMSIATTMESRAKKHQHQTPEMREAMKIFREWINKNKKDESEEIEGIDLDNIISEDLIDEGEGLFNPGTKDAVKGTGYGSKEKAEKTVTIMNKLKKNDHKHAMAIATTMMNRAEHSANQTDGMKAAIPVFKKWIENNRKT